MFTPGQPKHKMPMMDDQEPDAMDSNEPMEGEAEGGGCSPKEEAIKQLLAFLQQSEGSAMKSQMAPPKVAMGEPAEAEAEGEGELTPEMIQALKQMMG